MEQEQRKILVTWDFTEKSEHAFEHALIAAKNLKKHVICLTHIAKKESEIREIEQRLHGVISEKYSHLPTKPEAIVRAGNIFSTITEIADEEEATMVFMGTHGIKGMQKFFGSWALKVIAHTKVPFIVVQDKPLSDDYKNIVIPLNFRKENKECINWVAFFSKYFQAKFHVLTAKHTDPNLVKGIESNILFINKFFKSKGIQYEMDEAAGDTDFVKEALVYAKEKKADSILIMVTRDIGFTDYVLGAHEQYLIANELNIPVICINPRPPKIGGSFSTSGS